MNEEIIIQDLLKHLSECEYEGRPANREILAKELSLTMEQFESIAKDLEKANLVESGNLKLTPNGREYALHIVRAHRLYETFLAMKTGIKSNQWHTLAHAKEHTLSADDVNKLSRDLNYPRYDPHGDPIPTATGFMPAKRGQSLTEYSTGWEGKVVHIEDEPPRLYAHIVAASIAPGTILRIIKKDTEELQISVEGCEFTFSNEVAGQITVVPLTANEKFDESIQRLSSLEEEEEASVVRLSPLCIGLERNRLLDLGLVPGTVLSVDLVSPSGSPIAYRIRGASIALRRSQSELVLIRKTKENKNE